MGIITAGQVKNGVIVPNIPLPERAWCRIEVQCVPLEVPLELQEEFDDGKIQYAFVRVIDPNTELPKLILIGWVSLY